MACRSVTVRLSEIVLGLHVAMSSLTASKRELRARSLSLGDFQVLLVWKDESCSLAVGILMFSSKRYSASRKPREKS